MPRMLGDGDKLIEIMYGEEKNICTGPTKARQDNKLLYRYDEPNEPTKEGPLSFVLLVFPFVSVSIVSRGHPSPFSLVC
jgi:hypothetical protein